MHHYKITEEQIEELSKYVKEQAEKTLPKEWLPTEKDLEYAKKCRLINEGNVIGGIKRTFNNNGDRGMRKAVAVLIIQPNFFINYFEFAHRMPDNITPNEWPIYQTAILNNYYDLVEAKRKWSEEAEEQNIKTQFESHKSKPLVDIDYIKKSNPISISYDNEVETKKIEDIFFGVSFGVRKTLLISIDSLPKCIIDEFKDKILGYIKNNDIRKA